MPIQPNEPHRQLTCREVRAVDRFAIDKLGVSGIVLMENAGRGCVEIFLQQPELGPAVIYCGGGNNGGDGFVIARHLAIHRVPCRCVELVAADRLPPDARENREIAKQLTSVEWIDASHNFDATIMDATLRPIESQPIQWAIDAMLGTGATGALREPYLTVVKKLNNRSLKRLAVDIPTGLDGDRGIVVNEALRVDLTCTFVAIKPGLQQNQGPSIAGTVECISIGLPNEIIEAAVSFHRSHDASE